jgi:hypothetical protein
LLITALTNIDGTVMPILFDYQQYFLSCALFGLGLGFFQEPKLTLPLSPDGLEAEPGKIGRSWAIWLTVVMVVLLLVLSANFPGGLPNAISLTLQDESVDVFLSEFDSGRMAADIISVGLFSILLFAWLQIFVAPGKELKRLYPGVTGAKALAIFAAGGVLAWLATACLYGLPAPPAIVLIIPCLFFLALSEKREIAGLWCAAAIAICIYLNTTGLKSDISPPDQYRNRQYKNMASTCWVGGSRIDTRPLLNGDKLLALGVWSDRTLYDLLPATIPSKEDVQCLQKQCGLPEFPDTYKDLLYRAMPDMKDRQALLLGAGLGSEVEACLYHGLLHVTAVEPRRWLTDLSIKQSFSPYINKAVTLVAAAPRQFLRETKDQYDLILFGRHSAVNRPNPFIAINHDDYLYTVEAFYDALMHLTDDGQMVIVTQPGNELVRTRMAANVLALNSFIDAELTTPYANYLVVSKTSLKTGQTADIIDSLRKTLGSKVVNHQALLIKRASPAAVTSDDRPFIPGWGPMIPLADSFLAILTLLAMLGSLRLHLPQSIFQNTSKARCRAFLLGAIVTLLAGRGYMVVLMAYGTTPMVIYGSIIGFWLLLFFAAAFSARQSQPPTRLLSVAFGLSMAIDICFNYGAAAWLPNPLMKFATCAILPFAPAALAGGLLNREIIEGERETLGLALMGFAIGCLMGLSVMFIGRTALDFLVSGLALSVLLLTFRAKTTALPDPLG